MRKIFRRFLLFPKWFGVLEGKNPTTTARLSPTTRSSYFLKRFLLTVETTAFKGGECITSTPLTSVEVITLTAGLTTEGERCSDTCRGCYTQGKTTEQPEHTPTVRSLFSVQSFLFCRFFPRGLRGVHEVSTSLCILTNQSSQASTFFLIKRSGTAPSDSCALATPP